MNFAQMKEILSGDKQKDNKIAWHRKREANQKNEIDSLRAELQIKEKRIERLELAAKEDANTIKSLKEE